MSDKIVSICEVCSNPAIQKCGGCQSVHYCSREHQKSDWKKHKKSCRLYKVLEDEKVGRHLVATRDIKPGEIIVQEYPIVWGPCQVTVPVCLGCCQAINSNNWRPCSKCGWPVCSEICEKSPAHIPECQYTVSRGTKVSITTFNTVHPTYQCLTILRCLYQKQFLPEVWEKLNTLQSHCEERKKTPKYEEERTSIAQFILTFFKLRNIFTEEEILTICGIVTVNAHEVPLTDPAHVAIYEMTSMIEHSCSPNCSKTFTDQGSIIIKSGTNIKKGDHLSICYTDPLWGTSNRRYHLHETKYFWCACARCSDPTEFGTHFSALRCQQNACKGLLLPKSFLDSDDVNNKGPSWLCTKCNQSLSAYCVHDLMERIGQDLSDMKKGDSQACKDFISLYGKYLPNNHFHMVDVKFALSQTIGHEKDGGLPAVSEDDLVFKASLCRELSKLVEVLIPGETRMRGLLLFELHASVAEMGRRNRDPQYLQHSLLESQEVLKEAADLLKHEPPSLPEGKIYLQAIRNLKEIEVVLKTVRRNFLL